MYKLFSLCVILVCLATVGAGSAFAASAVQSNINGPFAFTDVTIVDVKQGRLLPNMTVVIKDNRISQVESSQSASLPSDAVVFPAKGKYLIPGLWDMHVHLLDDEEIAFPYLLANGVTGVRDMGATFSQIQKWQATIKAGALAPRLVFSGPALDGENTLGDGALMHQNLATEADARAKVQELKQFGVNFLKIYTYLPRRLYLAIADEANEAGIPFAGHVPFFVSAKEAAEMGQRSIEHLYGILLASSTQEDELREAYQHKLSYIFAVDLEAAKSFDERKAQELYATFVKQGTHLVPTLVTFHNLLSPLEPSRVKYAPTAVQKAWMDYQQKGKQGLEMSRSNIGPLYKIYQNVVHDMNEAGVPLMAGTDTLWHELEPIPNQVFGFSLHDELALLVEAGLTPLEALQAATITPAGFLGIADQTGSVEEGKWADLVLLEQNPLEDITHTREISAVVVDGQMLDKEALQTMIKTFPAPESNQSKRDK